MKFIILHGIQGFAGKHWMGWLHGNLAALGHEVVMPTLPNPDHPQNAEWHKAILALLTGDPSQIIVIGHSMGVPASLEVIQDLPSQINGFISVSGFDEDYGAELNSYFMKNCIIDPIKVKKNIKNIEVIFGDNDPYVPQQTLLKLAANLKVPPHIIKNGGHLNTDSGFTEFQLIIDLIKEFK